MFKAKTRGNFRLNENRKHGKHAKHGFKNVLKPEAKQKGKIIYVLQVSY